MAGAFRPTGQAAIPSLVESGAAQIRRRNSGRHCAMWPRHRRRRMCIRKCKFARLSRPAADPCRNTRNWVEAQGPWVEFRRMGVDATIPRPSARSARGSTGRGPPPGPRALFALCRTAQRNWPRADTFARGRGRHAVRSPSRRPSSKPRPVTPGGASGLWLILLTRSISATSRTPRRCSNRWRHSVAAPR